MLLIQLVLWLSLSGAAMAAPAPADYSSMNGLVSLDSCSGAILETGAPASGKALVLTAGHCVAREALLSPKGAIKNQPYLRSGIRIFGPDSMFYIPSGAMISFASMDGIDLGLIELPVTNEFLDKKRIRRFSITSSSLQKELAVRMISGHWLEEALCTLQGMAQNVWEGDFRFSGSWFLSSGCEKVVSGFSGSSVLNTRNEIVGLVYTTNTGVTVDKLDPELELPGVPCSLSNPCEKSGRNSKPATFLNRVYVQNVADWKVCVAEKFQGPSCRWKGDFLPHESAAPPLSQAEILELPLSALVRENEFDAVIAGVTEVYRPIAKLHGKELTVKNLWRSPEIEKTRQVGSSKSWEIQFSGALPRHPAISRDAFALAVCHEVGHQLGGYPYKRDSFEPGSKVHSDSAEGQADYFATLACTKKIWKGDPENALFRDTASRGIRGRCDLVWKNEAEQNLCYRTLVAVDSMARFFSSYHGLVAKPVRTETPDLSITKWSILDEGEYPAAQCRVDTMAAGALCARGFDESVKPGLAHPNGQESAAAEREAARFSCFAGDGTGAGARPLCWYLPKNIILP